jgi:hypothetical protein
MDGLKKTLWQVADNLSGAAIGLLLLRVLGEKDMRENMILTKHGDKDHPSTKRWSVRLSERVLEALQPWVKSLCPEGRFNAKVLRKDWREIRWDNEAALLKVEDDCRSMAFILRYWVVKKDDNLVDEDLLTVLHEKGLILFGLASTIIGQRWAIYEGLLNKTKGSLKKEFQQAINIRTVADLLGNNGNRITADLLKKASKQTGRSERRVREYIVEARKDPLHIQVGEFLAESKRSGKTKGEFFDELLAGIKELQSAKPKASQKT